jgi:hypothetical protein
MPFITLKSGLRVNLAHIESYIDADEKNGGGTWLNMTTVVEGTGMSQRADETPTEIDALIHKAERIAAHVRALVPICRVCGCTEDNACDEGCCWVEPDLCSACAMPGPAEEC